VGVLGAGKLVGDGDVILGQGLKAAVVVHVLLDLGGLVLRNTLGELLAAEETLQDVVGPAAGGAGAGAGEELTAQGAAAEAVDGLHFLEEELLLLAEGVNVGFHRIMYLCQYNMRAASLRPVTFRREGYSAATHPFVNAVHR
jgi:hypothetical protein